MLNKGSGIYFIGLNVQRSCLVKARISEFGTYEETFDPINTVPRHFYIETYELFIHSFATESDKRAMPTPSKAHSCQGLSRQNCPSDRPARAGRHLEGPRSATRRQQYETEGGRESHGIAQKSIMPESAAGVKRKKEIAELSFRKWPCQPEGRPHD